MVEETNDSDDCPGADCSENHCDVCDTCGMDIEIDECGDCLSVHCDSCDGDCVQEDD